MNGTALNPVFRQSRNLDFSNRLILLGLRAYNAVGGWLYPGDKCISAVAAGGSAGVAETSPSFFAARLSLTISSSDHSRKLCRAFDNASFYSYKHAS
jgi:hypothetical protein